jgi:hypothetical protein
MPDPGATRPLTDDQRFGLAKHGIAGPRGQAAPRAGGDGRFGRMFPQLAAADVNRDQLHALVRAMAGAAGESDPTFYLPAGYTYVCQFVDHDLTFDPNSRLQASNDPYTLVDFRTPRLDLDSVYGSGPMDQPFLYRWDAEPIGTRLVVEERLQPDGHTLYDLPRNGDGRALIGDARNDENAIISQLQTLFLRFHNLAVDHVWHHARPRPHAAGTFETAQRIVRWHYQWLVLNDVLPRIVGRATHDAVLDPAEPERVKRRFFHWGSRPFMPVEFSGAAYRFGHSLVREDYKVQDGRASVPIMRPKLTRMPQLSGFRALTRQVEIDWKHFFHTDPATVPQTAMRIDPSVALRLTKLLPDGKDLAELNLRRGRALGLPAGQDIALAMGIAPIRRSHILEPEFDLHGHATAIRNSTPLWYYVLREAELESAGETLGPVGGRIVAEVLVGLVQADPASYLSQNPRWRPGQSVDGGRTPALAPDAPIEEMAGLIRFVQSSGAVPVRPAALPAVQAAPVAAAKRPNGNGTAAAAGVTLEH